MSNSDAAVQVPRLERGKRWSTLAMTHEEEKRLFESVAKSSRTRKEPLKRDVKVKIRDPVVYYLELIEMYRDGTLGNGVINLEGIHTDEEAIRETLQLESVFIAEHEKPSHEFDLMIGGYRINCYIGAATGTAYIKRHNFDDHEVTEYLHHRLHGSYTRYSTQYHSS